MHISLNRPRWKIDASKAVMEWWYNAIPDAVFDTGDDDFFRWTDYVNKSENQKYEENRMLPFADYRETEHWIRTIRQRQKRFLKMVYSAISSTMGNFSRQGCTGDYSCTEQRGRAGSPADRGYRVYRSGSEYRCQRKLAGTQQGQIFRR